MVMDEDTPLMAGIKTSAKNLTNEIGVDWNDIPGTIAEGACYDLLSHFDMDATVEQVAEELGMLDEDGELA